MPYSNSSLSMYQSRYNSLQLYTLYQELIRLTVIKQSLYPTEYILCIQVNMKLAVSSVPRLTKRRT